MSAETPWTQGRDAWVRQVTPVRLLKVIAQVAERHPYDDPGDAREKQDAILWLATRGARGYEWGRAAESARIIDPQHAPS